MRVSGQYVSDPLAWCKCGQQSICMFAIVGPGVHDGYITVADDVRARPVVCVGTGIVRYHAAYERSDQIRPPICDGILQVERDGAQVTISPAPVAIRRESLELAGPTYFLGKIFVKASTVLITV